MEIFQICCQNDFHSFCDWFNWKIKRTNIFDIYIYILIQSSEYFIWLMGIIMSLMISLI